MVTICNTKELSHVEHIRYKNLEKMKTGDQRKTRATAIIIDNRTLSKQ